MWHYCIPVNISWVSLYDSSIMCPAFFGEIFTMKVCLWEPKSTLQFFGFSIFAFKSSAMYLRSDSVTYTDNPTDRHWAFSPRTTLPCREIWTKVDIWPPSSYTCILQNSVGSAEQHQVGVHESYSARGQQHSPFHVDLGIYLDRGR